MGTTFFQKKLLNGWVDYEMYYSELFTVVPSHRLISIQMPVYMSSIMNAG